MQVFDCFMYYNEDTILELRLNQLNQHVDYFIIVESTFNHKGEKKDLNFDINKFKKFKDKIKYYILDCQSPEIEEIKIDDSEDEKSSKYILNGYRRDHFQRNYLSEGIKFANAEDIIIISDIDEIPKLENVNLKTVGNNLIFFNQKMCYYMFNLYHENYNWVGSRLCKKKKLVNPQWLRDVKPKKYPFWRLDKIRNIQIIQDGGWHFAYLQKPENISKKIQSFAHGEFNKEHLINEENIKEKIKKGEDIFERGYQIKKIQIDSSYPRYILNNKDKLKDWIA